jgi:predicted transcriptional regulator/ribosomal protein S27AE
MPNNIAYYAEGDEERVNRLELVLNVHETQKAEAAHRALMTYSNELAYKALGEELRPKMQDAILAGRPYAYMVGELFVELKVEAWVTERGYDIKFIITQPIKISSPLKATDSQEVTTPISLPNFIESDSKDNSRARLPTSNLDYEPDETAIRILDFLAEPQHQTVYAVEIGNSLGLPQALVKSYLDKMAEEDYVLITRDNRTNSDVCTITQKGKKFLDKPVSETVNNQIEAVQERVEVTREYVENIANSLSDFEVELLSLFEGNQVLTLTEVLKRFPNIDGKRTRHTIKQLINKGLLESRTSVGTSQEIVKRVDMLKRPEIHHEPSASIVRSAVSLPEPDGEANAHSRLSPEYTCHTCGAAVAADEHDERAWRCSKCGASDQWWD